ncbi:DUF881 domain-containing protein [Nocardioides sp. YIM 152315]|uniref:DUF881 domain-containing protein n=1 Tax=Nocardioides sp. YIM 152315 TaxID=3031760 RepID=UPI0023DC3ABE|nr:DUF881 domain-containing protein [Nocardioides sp. YIM 152315]MDF1602548.1 DUF881 domain-containing protein [Nocardioides sp. YIM 152315]
MPDDRAPASSVDRARTPLLTLITQESLDEDYRHVADQRAAARASGAESEESSGTSRRSHWIAAAVVAAFGVLVTVAAVQTSASSGINAANRNSLLEQMSAKREDAAGLQRRIVRLREQLVTLQSAYERASDDQQAVDNRVERLAALTGFGAVSGPGVVITVDDAPDGEAVRAEDLATLVNGLWAAGAEAISINGKRLTARSAIFNTGAAINLNGSPPLSPPYAVSAIGDTRTLEADLLDTTSGLRFNNLVDVLGFPVKRQNVDDLTLPAATLRRPRHAVEGTAEQNRINHGKETAP